jgi:Maltose-binding periplasmic proteins/domains
MAFFGRHRALAAAAAGVCAATALTGCSKSGSDNQPEAEPSGPINVWVRGAGDSVKAYQTIFDAFTKKTGIKINPPFMTLTDFETKLSAAATAHNLPDLVVDDAAQLGSFETQGIIQEVDKNKIAGQDQLTERAWDSAKDLKGKYYAVPFSAQANVLLIRSDWLTKLNLQPRRPGRTWRRSPRPSPRRTPTVTVRPTPTGWPSPVRPPAGTSPGTGRPCYWQAGGGYFKSRATASSARASTPRSPWSR